MKYYKVVYETRVRPPCKCCVDENHPWVQRETFQVDSFEKAQRDERKVWEVDADVEVRHVDILTSTQSDWRPAGW